MPGLDWILYIKQCIVILVVTFFSLQKRECELQEAEKKLENTVHLLEEHLSQANTDAQKAHNNYEQELERER